MCGFEATPVELGGLARVSERVSRRAFQRCIDDESMLQRRKGALTARGALAEATAEADFGRRLELREIEPVRVDQLRRAGDLAAEADRMMRDRNIESAAAAIEGARDGEEG